MALDIALGRRTRQSRRFHRGDTLLMPDQSVEFASLLCSRLVHDLMSPVGALGNGLELLADEPDETMRARCMELVADSARASADKLKFFRLAFGAAGGLGDDIAAPEARAALEGLVAGNKRVELEWLVEQPGISRVATKLLLNLALIALDALVRGGRLVVGAEANEVVVRAESGRLVLDPEIRAVLAGEAGLETLSARTSAAWLVRRLAEAANASVALADDDPGVLVLAVTIPN